MQGLGSGFSEAVMGKVIRSKILGAISLLNDHQPMGPETERSFKKKKQSKSWCPKEKQRLVVWWATELSFRPDSVLGGLLYCVYFVSVFPLLLGLLEGLHITCHDLGAYMGVFSF